MSLLDNDSVMSQRTTPCNGCVCDILQQFDNPDLCTNETFTVSFGDPALDIGGLTFLSLNNETCCVRFENLTTGDTYAFDCRRILAISCEKTTM